MFTSLFFILFTCMLIHQTTLVSNEPIMLYLQNFFIFFQCNAKTWAKNEILFSISAQFSFNAIQCVFHQPFIGSPPSFSQ